MKGRTTGLGSGSGGYQGSTCRQGTATGHSDISIWRSVVQHDSPLRIRRLAAGLSQQTLATQAGCSLTTIRLVEYGFRCSDGMSARIAAALSIEPAQLFEAQR